MEPVYIPMNEVLGGIAEPVIIEIGAHVGHDTRSIRSFFPRAKIWAFEPDPRNIYRLKKDGVDKIATVIDAAVSDTDGFAEFHLSGGTAPRDSFMAPMSRENGDWSYSSSLKRPTGHLSAVPWVKFARKAKVRTVRLDTFCPQHGIDHVDFIWADVQGAEDLLIAGAQQTLARTSYFYTEFSEVELYEGNLNKAEILKRLPGSWEVFAVFHDDFLLRNVSLVGPRPTAASA